ncbi:MAG: signal peptidase I [Brevefilum sp.]|jgi:signal peptidase I
MDQYQSERIIEDEQEELKRSSRRSGCMGFFIDTIETILLALVLFLAINALSARVRVENVSMKPTLNPGEFLLVNRVAYKLGEPSIGDIVVFHAPGASELDYIKRVIGLPGDEVRVADGTVFVNDHPLYEPYLADQPNYSGSWTVPDGEYFVLGDNRNNSSDSHLWGFVPKQDLVGRALLIYWPLEDIAILRTHDIVQAVHN